jgi:hypothetical protein
MHFLQLQHAVEKHRAFPVRQFITVVIHGNKPSGDLVLPNRLIAHSRSPGEHKDSFRDPALRSLVIRERVKYCSLWTAVCQTEIREGGQPVLLQFLLSTRFAFLHLDPDPLGASLLVVKVDGATVDLPIGV